jgi:hypothetical protein
MDSLIKKICAGDVRSASRLIRDIEDKIPEAKAKIKKLYAHTGKSFIIGITGAPGVGKSTLTDALITELRKQKKPSACWPLIRPALLPAVRFWVIESACSAMPKIPEFLSDPWPPAAHWEVFRGLRAMLFTSWKQWAKI